MAKIDALEQISKEYGIITCLYVLNETEDMLPLIANLMTLGGRYKKLPIDEILTVLKAAY